MEFLEYVRVFIGTETPFMLLFIALFFYNIKMSREREVEHHKLMESKFQAMQEDINVLIQVWKILLEKELKERKENEL